MISNRCPYCMEEIDGNTVCPHCHKDINSLQEYSFALPHGMILHGKYLIGSVLGQGGFGITYIGFDLSLEMKVAIKEYYPQNIASRSNNSVLFHSASQLDENQFAMTFNLGSSTDFNLHFGMDFLFCNKGLGGYFGLGYGYKESYHYSFNNSYHTRCSFMFLHNTGE